jgi:hypothetical protein
MTSLQPVEQLLLDFLAIPSISGSETAFAEFLCTHLKQDFTIERIPLMKAVCILVRQGNPKNFGRPYRYRCW